MKMSTDKIILTLLLLYFAVFGIRITHTVDAKVKHEVSPYTQLRLEHDGRIGN